MSSDDLKEELKSFLDKAYNRVSDNDNQVLSYEHVFGFKAALKNYAIGNNVNAFFVGEINCGFDTDICRLKTVSVWIIGSLVLRVVTQRDHNDNRSEFVELSIVDIESVNGRRHYARHILMELIEIMYCQ